MAKKSTPIIKKKLSKPQKLTNEQFFSLLRENAGLFSRTARAIETQFGIKFSRQAVRQRAEKNPEILADIEEENLDIAEEGLNSIMRSRSENIRLDAVKYYLDRKGKKRGYVQKSEVDTTLNVKESQQITIMKDGKEISLKIKGKTNELPAK